jgi:hypothetical protein
MFKQKNAIALIILIFISANISAQQATAIKLLQFHSINNIGLLEGQTGSAFQLQTINGVQYKSWFTGVGLGLDYYRYRTIPLFIDVRKEFGKTKSKFFMYADGGINFGWPTEKQKMQYVVSDKFGTGFYYDAGAGYKIFINKKNGLLLSAGYAFKKVQETTQQYYFNPGGLEPLNPATQKYVYSLNRFTFKIGWEF